MRTGVSLRLLVRGSSRHRPSAADCVRSLKRWRLPGKGKRKQESEAGNKARWTGPTTVVWRRRSVIVMRKWQLQGHRPWQMSAWQRRWCARVTLCSEEVRLSRERLRSVPEARRPDAAGMIPNKLTCKHTTKMRSAIARTRPCATQTSCFALHAWRPSAMSSCRRMTRRAGRRMRRAYGCTSCLSKQPIRSPRMRPNYERGLTSSSPPHPVRLAKCLWSQRRHLPPLHPAADHLPPLHPTADASSLPLWPLHVAVLALAHQEVQQPVLEHLAHQLRQGTWS